MNNIMNPISIVIVDDHKLIREAWSLFLDEDKRFKVVGDFDSVESAIQKVRSICPDIILLDICLPGINGIEAVPVIQRETPNTKIIGISIHSSPIFARKMIQAGAKGYVTKGSTQREMIEAILLVQAGKTYICKYIKDIITEDFTTDGSFYNKIKILSPRELEIIELIKKGLSSKEIAKQLSISTKTVEVHRYNVLRKLNLKNTSSLINFINKS